MNICRTVAKAVVQPVVIIGECALELFSGGYLDNDQLVTLGAELSPAFRTQDGCSTGPPAVQKDFGTDNYLNKLAPARLLEKHCKVRVARYISWKRALPYSPAKLKSLICEEISHNRPLFLHFAKLENSVILWSLMAISKHKQNF